MARCHFTGTGSRSFFPFTRERWRSGQGTDISILFREKTIFLNGGEFHSYAQTGKRKDCLCPNIVFSGELIAPVTGMVYQKYLSAVLYNPSLPYFILGPDVEWQAQIIKRLYHVYGLLAKYGRKGLL